MVFYMPACCSNAVVNCFPVNSMFLVWEDDLVQFLLFTIEVCSPFL